MKKNNLVPKVLISVLITLMAGSLFIPFYASTGRGMFPHPLTIIGSYTKNEEFFIVYNGFNSSFGIFNLICSFIVLILLFTTKTKLKTLAVLTLSCFTLSLILVRIGLYAAGIFLSPPDKLLNGFKLMVLCEALLCIYLFVLAYRQKQTLSQTDNNELLDNL
jgi:hypothetical protein